MFSNFSYVSSRYTRFKYYNCVDRIRNRNYLPIRNVFSQKIYPPKSPNQFDFFQKLNSKYFLFEKKGKDYKNVARIIKRMIHENGKNPSKKPDKRPLIFLNLVLVLLITSDLLLEQKSLDWDTFVTELLPTGKIEKIIVFPKSEVINVYITRESGKPLSYKFPPGSKFSLIVNNYQNFEKDLRDEENRLGIAPSHATVVIYHDTWLLPHLDKLFACLLILYLLGYNMKSLGGMRFGIQKFLSTRQFVSNSNGKGVKFSDVAGLREAKMEIKEFIDYLKTPEQYKRLGAKVPKGALLLGPPGCGKTLLAKAVATEAKVPFLSINGSEFMELVGGSGAAKVRNLFSEARGMSPCIIYIDEIDGIGRKRSSGKVGWSDNFESEQTLNQLLVEMDGVASTEGVVTLASTNRAQILDKALLRPGRFDRHILIDLPTVEERREIFIYHLKSKRLEHKPEYYAKRLALLTPGFSGADIGNVCNEATLHAVRFKKKIVTGEDLDYAIARVIGGMEKNSSVLSPEEKHLAAYHEAGRALVGWLSEHGDVLLKISVVPRTNHSIGWTQFSPSEQYLFTKEELFDKMCMTLGGRAAESLIFNRVTTKSEKELVKVTKIAYAQVRQYGMNELIGPLSFSDVDRYNIKPYSKQLDSLIDEEARKLIARAFAVAESILRENKQKLIKLAEELVKRETMSYDEVVAVIGPPKYSDKKAVEPLMFDMSVNAAAPSQSDDHTPNMRDSFQ